MKRQPANNQSLVKARPASGKIVQALSAQLGVSQFEEIVAALRRQSESGFLSLAPGFSQVSGADKIDKPFQRFLRAGGKPVKRFTGHAVVNTRLKPGANERSRSIVPSDLCGTTALTPALSPRRGRIVRCLLEGRETAVARRATCKNGTANRCSLSPGERVRVRASVKTNFKERDGIHVASHGTKLIPKKQLEQKLHEAVRLARERFEENKLR
jgi:hypothetical protein